MMEVVNVNDSMSEEYIRLSEAVTRINLLTEGKAEAYIKDVCYDFGENWFWTTICSKSKRYQMLTPKIKYTILNGTLEEYKLAIDEVVKKFNKIH